MGKSSVEKRVNASMGIALMHWLGSQGSWGTLATERPFALNKGFCRVAEGKDVAEK